MAQRAVPAPFLTKTYELVDDAATDDVISWGENGSTFVVWKTADFAKDLLPNYFKHNNFSSFVRQLNTYGFRKIVPDKWEFANDNFKQGQKELLSKIRRRKSVTPARTAALAAEKSKEGSRSNSREDLGSTSTTSPDSKNPGSVETAAITDLSVENKKLKEDNKMLSSELAQTKKQCEELVAFLTKYLKVGPGQINQIMQQGIADGEPQEDFNKEEEDDDDENAENAEDEEDGACGGGLKLFGVMLKKGGTGGDGAGKKKRLREENFVLDGPHAKEVKIM